MAGLVGYGSSDEEDSVDEGRGRQLNFQTPPLPELSTSGRQQPTNDTRNVPTTVPAEDEAFSDPAHTKGAILGPPRQTMNPKKSASSAPSLPYSLDRATIRSLTLPTNPNLDIPQSPPGSPTPGGYQKFSHFLELKKQGVHFNTKLASSLALKNPSLLPKLMDFAGLDSERQYDTTLPTELWDPAGFPTWAYKEELGEAQHELSRKKQEETNKLQRESVAFVAASTAEQPKGSNIAKGARASAAERYGGNVGAK